VAHGEVETEEGVLVIRRIHVVLTLRGASADKLDAAGRAHDAVKMRCPIYRSLHRAIDITTELQFADADALSDAAPGPTS
jgi:uncharacterized OsmC-like protein